MPERSVSIIVLLLLEFGCFRSGTRYYIISVCAQSLGLNPGILPLLAGICSILSWKLRFSGLSCKQIILDIAPVFLPDYGTDNLYF